MGYTRNPGKGESDSASRSSYARTGKHDVKDRSGGQSARYSHFLKTGDPTGGGQVRSSSGLAPEARAANRVAASASARHGQVGLVQPTGYRYSSAGYGAGANPTGGTPVGYGYKKSGYRHVAEQAMMAYTSYLGVPRSFWGLTEHHKPMKGAAQTLDQNVYVPAADVTAKGVDIATGGLITDSKWVYTSGKEYISGGIDTVRDSYTEIISSTGDLGNIVGEVKDFSKIAVIGLAAVAAIMLFRR